MPRYEIGIFWDEIGWVAAFAKGPDVSAQGMTPQHALSRLALTLECEAQQVGGNVRDIPQIGFTPQEAHNDA